MTTLTLAGWTGPWPEDDKDANLKADIAAHAHLDPLSTITNLSNAEWRSFVMGPPPWVLLEDA